MTSDQFNFYLKGEMSHLTEDLENKYCKEKNDIFMDIRVLASSGLVADPRLVDFKRITFKRHNHNGYIRLMENGVVSEESKVFHLGCKQFKKKKKNKM